MFPQSEIQYSSSNSLCGVCFAPLSQLQPHLRGAKNGDVFNDQAAAAAAAMKAKNENTKFVVGSSCSNGVTTIHCDYGCDITNGEISCSSGESSDEEENDSNDDDTSGESSSSSSSSAGMKCMSICMRHSGLDKQAACENEHTDNCNCKWDGPICNPVDE